MHYQTRVKYINFAQTTAELTHVYILKWSVICFANFIIVALDLHTFGMRYALS
jgi:hypothetical protein